MSTPAPAPASSARDDRRALNRLKHERTIIRHQEKKKRKMIERGVDPEEAERLMAAKRRKKWEERQERKAQKQKENEKKEMKSGEQEESESQSDTDSDSDSDTGSDVAVAVSSSGIIPSIPEQKLRSLRGNPETVRFLAQRAVNQVFDNAFDRIRKEVLQSSERLIERIRSGDVDPPPRKAVTLEDLLLTPQQRSEREKKEAKARKLGMTVEQMDEMERKEKEYKRASKERENESQSHSESESKEKQDREQRVQNELREQQERMETPMRQRIEELKKKRENLASKLEEEKKKYQEKNGKEKKEKGGEQAENEKEKEKEKSVDKHGDVNGGLFAEPGLSSGWDQKTKLVAELEEDLPQTIRQQFIQAAIEEEKHGANKKAKFRALGEFGELLKNYDPQLLVSFGWNESGAEIDRSSPESLTRSVQQRITIPGVPRVYQQPQLPLKLECKPNWQPVEKSPIAALMVALSQSSQAFSFLDSSSDSSAPVSFVAFRHSIRHILMGLSEWRVDVQRLGNFIYLRRYTNYDREDQGDAGHMFEAACTKPAGAESDAAHFRSIVKGKLGRHQLITSIEVDAVQPSSSADAPQLKSFIELKTHKGGKLAATKAETIWFQAFLGGISTVKIAEKSDEKEKLGRGKGEIVTIEKIVDRAPQSLISLPKQAALLAQLNRVLDFLVEHVKEGKVYKLSRSKDEQGKRSMKLEQIKHGMETAPIVSIELIQCIEGLRKSKESKPDAKQENREKATKKKEKKEKASKDK